MEGNELILKAPEGLIFRVQETGRREIVIELIYDYQKPIIPKGFEYVKGEWNNGFTIKSRLDESEFVWIPVGFLEEDGSLDEGQHFGEKFGRRAFWGGGIDRDYKDVIPDNLIDSINKYGGVWISAYVASEEENGFVFKKGVMPFRKSTREKAIEAARSYADKYDGIKSCIPGEAGYDTLFKWIIQTGAKTKEEVCVDSRAWGNYTGELMPTGSSEKYCVNNIYDLAGNAGEVTGCLCQGYLTVYRSGIGGYGKGYFPASAHSYNVDSAYEPEFATFRVFLYLE